MPFDDTGEGGDRDPALNVLGGQLQPCSVQPRPEWGFPGLQPGDRWCLCAPRWQEAHLAGRAPPVVLASTHQAALQHCALDDLQRYVPT